MPRRIFPLVTDQYYHVYNRSVHKVPIFVNKSICLRAMIALDYYQYSQLPMRLSYFLSYGADKRVVIEGKIKSSPKLVEILAFCLMPNHYHLLLKQLQNNGISTFMKKFQNSFTRYKNTRHRSDGPSFKGQFQAVRIEDDDQLLHVHRYIHLNPFTAYVVKTIEDLQFYPYSSFPEYLGSTSGFCNKDMILSFFPSRKKYEKFVLNQADYQQRLEKIRHLMKE